MGTKKNKQVDSVLCGSIGPKDVGTQSNACHLSVGHSLNGRPPLGVEQNLVVQPIADQLLFDGRSIKELSDSLCKGSLAASNGNRLSKGGDVRFIHEHREYTNRFVQVNNPVCVTQNKGACIVQLMPALKKKQVVTPSAARVAIPGPDGKTLGQRVTEAMAYRSGTLQRSYRQADLMEDINRIAGIPEDQAQKTQQLLSAIMNSKVSKSSITTYIAAACGVNPVWLASGIGRMLDS